MTNLKVGDEIVCECEHANHFEETQLVSRGYSHEYGARTTHVIRAGAGLLICADCDRAGHAPRGR
jgi:hypothetical protein